MSLRGVLRGRFTKPYQQIHAAEAKGRMESGAILLDVRESNEWQAGHVQGARHIPLGQMGVAKIGRRSRGRILDIHDLGPVMLTELSRLVPRGKCQPVKCFSCL
jgi:hypothetical protein